MKKNILLFPFFVCVVPAIAKPQERELNLDNLNQPVRKERETLKDLLATQGSSPMENRVTLVTFAINLLSRLRVGLTDDIFEIRSAYYSGTGNYDSIIGVYYKELHAMLDPVNKKNLERSHTAWQLYRDHKIRFIQTIFMPETEMDPMTAQIIHAKRIFQLYQNRAIRLMQHSVQRQK